MRAALAELGVDSTGCATSSMTRRWAMAVSAGWPPVSWRAWPRCPSPHYGYGIRYNHGMFRQVIQDGWQHEYPENWLSFGNPWEFDRPEASHQIGFGGMVEARPTEDGGAHHIWHPAETVDAVAYDTPVIGWRGTLRQHAAAVVRARPDPLRLDTFNRGDHVGALAARDRANAISQVLYPSDETAAGQELRLRQEYFFTSASLQDLVARHMRQQMATSAPCPTRRDPAERHASGDRGRRADADSDGSARYAVGRGVADHHRHDLLHQPHAAAGGAGELAGSLMERLLPRHMQIIYQINRLHLDAVCALPGTTDRRSRSFR